VNRAPPIFGLESPATCLPIDLPITKIVTEEPRSRRMEPKSLDGLPTIVADMECLRQQLRELHAAVKAQNAQRQEPSSQPAGGGMLIRGK